jgi:hypothetical protein
MVISTLRCRWRSAKWNGDQTFANAAICTDASNNRLADRTAFGFLERTTSVSHEVLGEHRWIVGLERKDLMDLVGEAVERVRRVLRVEAFLVSASQKSAQICQ